MFGRLYRLGSDFSSLGVHWPVSFVVIVFFSSLVGIAPLPRRPAYTRRAQFPPHHPKSDSFIDFILPKVLFGFFSLAVGVAVSLLRHPHLVHLDRIDWLQGRLEVCTCETTSTNPSSDPCFVSARSNGNTVLSAAAVLVVKRPGCSKIVAVRLAQSKALR